MFFYSSFAPSVDYFFGFLFILDFGSSCFVSDCQCALCSRSRSHSLITLISNFTIYLFCSFSFNYILLWNWFFYDRILSDLEMIFRLSKWQSPNKKKFHRKKQMKMIFVASFFVTFSFTFIRNEQNERISTMQWAIFVFLSLLFLVAFLRRCNHF